MKLIVVGATGFVATEVIRQSLRMDSATEVIALGRTHVDPPTDANDDGLANGNKLKSVVIKDYEQYSDDVKKELAGADAVIWTVAVTPSKSKKLPIEEVKRVCDDCTFAGIDAIISVRGDKSSPLRFIYVSGAACSRDPNDNSLITKLMPDYAKIRNGVEQKLVQYQTDHTSDFQLCVVRPGLILAKTDWVKWLTAPIVKLGMRLPNIKLEDVAACLLSQAVRGIKKDPILNDEAVEIAKYEHDV